MSDVDCVKERRFKILTISSQFMVDVLNWWRSPPGFLALPINEELPEDCVVVSVSSNWASGCLEALVASREFPPCAEGDLPSRIPGVLSKFRSVAFVDLVRGKV